MACLVPFAMGVRQCERVHCDRLPDGKLECTKTGSCEYDGKTHQPGDAFPSTDGCNQCNCGPDGSVACTERACLKMCGGLTGAGCPDGQYCDFPADAMCGAADQTGSCETSPEVCPDIYDPVCGCDDKTYGNACEAAAEGVSVASVGECKAEGCEYNGKHYAIGASFPSSDGCNQCSCQAGGVACTKRACVNPSCGGLLGTPCAKGQYCNFPPDAMCGAADQTGTCAPIPTACTKEFKPVCGCDDKTYGNACEAAAAGVSILHDGECGGGGSADGCDYDGKHYNAGDSFPATDGCNKCNCQDGGRVVCTLIACPAPVTCGGITGKACPKNQYCNFPSEAMCGAADQTGTCAPIPTACTQEHKPVCGCDDKTYGNACSAAAAGVSTLHDGACSSAGGCEYLGKRYNAGDSFPAIDGCNMCGCGDNGGAVCTAKACQTPTTCGGIAGKTCPKNQYCNFPIKTMCGSGDQTGTCSPIPEACTLEYNPVCGCDGKTHGNACAAAGAGVSVASQGECASAGPACGPREQTCACATGHYCLRMGAACIQPQAACP